jgi:SAM-dependent methyltransferase
MQKPSSQALQQADYPALITPSSRERIDLMAATETTDWTSGYVADVGYTYGYYNELNPVRTQLALLNAGLVAPRIQQACELGFGQGVSVAIHATASETKWSGTDFNPSQADHARSLVAAADVTADLGDAAFGEFCGRDDLPEFDYIGLHGIWSWISDENRAVIVDFVRRKLKLGGVLYISYNTLPGWAANAPLRHLMTEHAAKLSGPSEGSLARVDAALGFIDRFLETNPRYLQSSPNVKVVADGLKTKDRAYLAHEYFNRDWHPMYVADMARWLSPAKVAFAASAYPIDSVPSINLTADQQQQIAAIPDPILRETLRDFCVNQQFRRDYWIKGPRRLSPLEQTEQLRALRFVLVRPRAGIPMKVSAPLGEADLSEAIYTPLLDLLADHKARSLGEIEAALKVKGINFGHVVQAALILTGSGFAAGVQEQPVISRAKKRTDKLNAYLLQRARGSNEVTYLASPVTGGGFAVNRFQQIFLLAQKAGRKTPDDWAVFTHEILTAQGQKILKEGKPLESDEDNLAELKTQAKEFAEQVLPILRALEVV